MKNATGRKCKRCGTIIEDGWKCCPNCSKNVPATGIKKIVEIIVFIMILSFFVCFAVMFYWTKQSPIQNIKRTLKSRYQENFEIMSEYAIVPHKDQVMGCDGSTCGVIKGKGDEVYYKIFSTENNIEFLANYSSTHPSGTIKDNYKQVLSRRDYMNIFYDRINSIADNGIGSMIFYDYIYEKDVEIHTKSELDELLNKVPTLDETELNYIRYSNKHNLGHLKLHISNVNLKDFCIKNEDKIRALSKELNIANNEYSVTLEVVFDSDSEHRLVFNNIGICVNVDEKYSSSYVDFDTYLAN